jgi:hypothetical protein
VDPTVVGDMWRKDFLAIEGVRLVKIYMIEICMHHHPLLARCGLSLEEILMRILQLPKITEGTHLICAMMENTMNLIPVGFETLSCY